MEGSGARPSDQRTRHPSPARRRRAAGASSARSWSPARPSSTRRVARPVGGRRSDRSGRPVRHQQARAGDGRAPFARTAGPPGQAVQPRRPAAGAALRDVCLRAAVRPHRSRTRSSRSCRSATWTRAATSPTSATSFAPIARWSRAALPGRPYNVCSGRGYRVGDLLDILLALSRVRVRVETDPARLRPSDNPVIVGDPTRLAAETGWRQRFRSSRRWRICSITGDPPSPAPIHGQHEPGPAALGERPADRPHVDGRLRPAAPLADVVAGHSPGRRRARVQPAGAAVDRRPALSAGRSAAAPARHPRLSASRS